MDSGDILTWSVFVCNPVFGEKTGETTVIQVLYLCLPSFALSIHCQANFWQLSSFFAFPAVFLQSETAIFAFANAIFAQRPLLEALQEYERDYLFQVKENQPKVLKKMKEVFKDVEL